jgi:type II secretory pathway component PulF
MSIRLPNKEKLTLIQNLSYLLNGGIPIMSALMAINKDSKGSMKKVTEQLIEDVQQGNKLHQAMEKFPDSFDTVMLNLIKTGEESGNLEIVLAELHKKIKKDMDFIRQVRAALAYPIFVFLLTLFILGVILTLVVPKISEVFIRLELDLNIGTRFIIWLSGFVVNNSILVVVLLVLFVFGLIMGFKYFNKRLVKILHHVPYISNLIKFIDLTVFTRNMGLMLKAGVPIQDALELSRNIVHTKRMSEAIEGIKETVSEGKPMSSEIAKHPRIFPHMMFQIVEIAERSGTLETSLMDLSEQYDEITTNTLKTLTNLIEPMLIAFVGIIVGGILLSIIAPIYQLIGQISPNNY